MRAPRAVAMAAAAALSTLSLALPATSAARGPRTFYVATNGHDYVLGTSPRHPWRSVTRVDKARLRPGDRVLFRGGDSFGDNTLMPGWGVGVSGTGRSSIMFASYGRGFARLVHGVWLGTNARHPRGPRHLTFKNLILGPGQGFQGTGDFIHLTGLRIGNLRAPSSREIGISTRGSYWLIARNKIDRTGGSGMLLGFNADSAGDPAGGHGYIVFGNTITNTGLDPSIGYPTHAIYLKVADAAIAFNWIANFSAEGVSARYHDATITGNYIVGGSTGIGWYQYDTRGATSHFTDNTIADTRLAGIFVCGILEGCRRPLESFVIARNKLRRTGGVQMNLQPTAGRYMLAANG